MLFLNILKGLFKTFKPEFTKKYIFFDFKAEHHFYEHYSLSGYKYDWHTLTFEIMVSQVQTRSGAGALAKFSSAPLRDKVS